jgi:hypothetical protein
MHDLDDNDNVNVTVNDNDNYNYKNEYQNKYQNEDIVHCSCDKQIFTKHPLSRFGCDVRMSCLKFVIPFDGLR